MANDKKSTIGSAFVQIVPSAEGIQGSVSKVLNGEASSAGKSAGSTIAGKIKGIIATAAIGETLKNSILQGAALEQSLGGIETLFKEHADTVIKNASNAYKTTGLSANAYMENATSFAASLLSSVSGNTEKAAQLTDMALIDMSDNANKMGSSMESITNAYQGFAKQNYTMLDNLKLGYGGTKSEMERLLADATKLSGVKYDISNLSDVYSAIHVIQENLGITGTTSKEAAETISGSFASMKAAAEDFMGNLVLGKNVGSSMAALAETSAIFLFDNLMPAVGNIIKSLPEVIMTFIKEGTPRFAQSGYEMIKGITLGIVNNLPAAVSAATEVTKSFTEHIRESFPLFLEKGADVINEFVIGILNNLPAVIAGAGIMIGKLLFAIVDFIEASFPTILYYGGELLGNLAGGILANLPELLGALAVCIGSIISGLTGLIPTLLEAGVDLISGLASGIAQGVSSKLSQTMDTLKKALTKPIDDARNLIKSIIDKIKSYFNVTLKFNGLKMPHIDLSWNTSGVIAKAAKLLGIPGVPKFSVNWYAKGGIFDNPSIIGVGEAGSEAVVPLEKLWSKLDSFIGNRMDNAAHPLTEAEIRAIVRETISSLSNEMLIALSGIKIEHVTTLNAKVIAREIISLIDERLGRNAILAERGL